jgi:hypothetical protein
MTACPNCGKDPCSTPVFCANCLGSTNDLGATLTAKLKEQAKEQEARQKEQEVRLKELAAKDPISYDQQRRQAAKELGVLTETLDKEVAKRRRKRPSEKKPADDDDKAKVKELEQAAGDIIRDPDILERFGKAVESAGLVGETSNAKILYLALTSRLFEKPVSLALKGVSAGGKSFTVESVLRFFPASAYFARTGFSEKALYFSNEDFRHRFIVLFEATGMASEYLSYVVRTLLSENRLSYELPVKTEDGITPQVLEKEGPIGLLTTTTAPKLHPENETRLLSLGVSDTKQQTQAVMRTLAAERAAGFDYAPWQAFQEWLTTGARSVAVPYAPWLAERIPPVAVRLRRDFGMLLSLIRAHALLHRGTRDKDAQGRVVASPADYAAVYYLVESLFSEGVEVTVPETVRETVEAVRGCLATGGSGKTDDGAPAVSLTSLARDLKLDKNSVHHRVKKATGAGYLANLEVRKGKPAQIVLADPLPEEGEILPSPEALAEALECWSDFRGDPQEGVYQASGGNGHLVINQGVTEGAQKGIPPSDTHPLENSSNTPTPANTSSNSDGAAWGPFSRWPLSYVVRTLADGPAATSTPSQPNPLPNTPNTRTPPSNSGGNGQGQEPPPGTVSAKVTVREIWRPGLGPLGDDIFDL